MKDLTTRELMEKRDRLRKINWREYTTRGNTQRCQELFKEIEALDEEIKRRRDHENEFK